MAVHGLYVFYFFLWRVFVWEAVFVDNALQSSHPLVTGETLEVRFFGDRDRKTTPFFVVKVGCGTLAVTVTTRIITFLAGDSYKPSFATVTGRGPHPK